MNLADWHGAFRLLLADVEEKDPKDVELFDRQAKKRKVEEIITPRKANSRLSRQQAQEINEEFASDNEHGEASQASQKEARFLQAVADLAFLGTIQPTKRKIEHIARVAF